MADQAAKTRADAIEAFATVLRGLRGSVGNPSFREMSGRSRAISHTTLHEAAQGYRLPSWATTVEFVKACGADPAEYRKRWEQADWVIRSVNSPGLTTPPSDPEFRSSSGIAIPATGGTDRRAIQVAVGRESAAPPTPRDAPASADPPAPPVIAAGDGRADASAARHRRRLRSVLAIAATVGVIAVATLVAVLALGGDDSPHDKGNGIRQPPNVLSPADCPVHQSNPPLAPPAHSGDASSFVADITLPDCTHVSRGQTTVKVWRLKNVGKVPWMGYSLRRLDSPQQRNECQTISDVPVDDTPPGHLVDIRTEITAPKRPGFCFARFKMVDAAGHIAFPGSRPVNFQIIVD